MDRYEEAAEASALLKVDALVDALSKAFLRTCALHTWAPSLRHHYRRKAHRCVPS